MNYLDHSIKLVKRLFTDKAKVEWVQVEYLDGKEEKGMRMPAKVSDIKNLHQSELKKLPKVIYEKEIERPAEGQ